MSSTQVRVRRAKRLAPDRFRRVRAACVYSDPAIDLDDHAARIVLLIASKQGKSASAELVA